jgi:hypothetical protein
MADTAGHAPGDKDNRPVYPRSQSRYHSMTSRQATDVRLASFNAIQVMRDLEQASLEVLALQIGG